MYICLPACKENIHLIFSGMTKNVIDNRLGFSIYLAMNLLFSLLGLALGILSVRGLITNDWTFLGLIEPFYGLIPLFILFIIVDFLVKPTYVEISISGSEIAIKTYIPNTSNRLRFLLMLKYREHLAELRLSQREYNNYTLTIGALGFRKILTLQKIENGKVYQTSEINVSLLGQKKYTLLVLSLDRLRGKINLN